MARLLTSALLFALTCSAFAQSFGRFGYAQEGVTPGFEITKQGFRVRHAASDWFKFDNPSKAWKATSTSEVEQYTNLAGVGLSPDKLRQNLLALGFSLYFKHGIRFKLSSTAAPFLTWSEGSVGVDVAAAKSKWVAVSFRDQQPPVLFVFEGDPVPLKLTGKAGAWAIKSEGGYDGWVRVIAPNGTKPLATNRAADLGQLLQLMKAEKDLFLAPVPKIVDYAFAEEPTAVTVSWTLDRPWALMPQAVYTAPIGGYRVSSITPIRATNMATEEGPVHVAKTTEIKLRLPVIRVPSGRAVFAGVPETNAIATASPHDVNSVAELAFANLYGWRDEQVRTGAEETFETFFGESAYQPEPNTGQTLPYAASGAGLDIAAANALLMQSVASSSTPQPADNSVLTSLSWRRDWSSWTFLGADPEKARRAAAIVSVAGLIGATTRDRVEAAMFHAGLAGERGLAIWKRRRGLLAAEPKLLEPLDGFRKLLYFSAPASEEHPLLSALAGLRVYSDLSVQAKQEGDKVVLRAEFPDARPRRIDLRGPHFEVLGSTNSKISSIPVEGGIDILVEPKAAGACEITLTVKGGFLLPVAQPPLRYEEVSR